MDMAIIENLRKQIEAYEGPLPAIGDSIEEIWFRQAVRQLLDLERQVKAS